jgi:hypothetical protein
MRLIEALSLQLLRTQGAYVTEACDRCDKILGPVRYTSQGEKGEGHYKLYTGVGHQTLPLLPSARNLTRNGHGDANCNTAESSEGHSENRGPQEQWK